MQSLREILLHDHRGHLLLHVRRDHRGHLLLHVRRDHRGRRDHRV